jgi:hypothetical protein
MYSESLTQFVVIVTVTSTSSQSSNSPQFLSMNDFVGLLTFFVFVKLLNFSMLYILMNAIPLSFNESISRYFQTNGFFMYTLAASEAFCACSVVFTSLI